MDIRFSTRAMCSSRITPRNQFAYPIGLDGSQLRTFVSVMLIPVPPACSSGRAGSTSTWNPGYCRVQHRFPSSSSRATLAILLDEQLEPGPDVLLKRGLRHRGLGQIPPCDEVDVDVVAPWMFLVIVPSRMDPCGYTSPPAGESSQYSSREAPTARYRETISR